MEVTILKSHNGYVTREDFNAVCLTWSPDLGLFIAPN